MCPLSFYGQTWIFTTRRDIIRQHVCQTNIPYEMPHWFYPVSRSHYFLGIYATSRPGGAITGIDENWEQQKRLTQQRQQNTTFPNCRVRYNLTEYRYVCTGDNQQRGTYLYKAPPKANAEPNSPTGFGYFKHTAPHANKNRGYEICEKSDDIVEMKVCLSWNPCTWRYCPCGARFNHPHSPRVKKRKEDTSATD